MFYREYRPDPPLSQAVACYWSIGGGATMPVKNRVLPDGCFDLLFVISGRAERGSFAALGAGGFVIGPMRRGMLVEIAMGTRLFGVRFRPGVLSRRFGGSLERLLDQSIPGDLVLGPAFRAVEDAVASAESDQDRVAFLDRLLGSWPELRSDPGPIGLAISLLASGTLTGLPELGERLGLSERTLQRLFRREVGLSPKEVGRLIRFRRGLKRLEGGRSGLARLAFELGYADQAHFTREFRSFAGIPPAAFVAETDPTAATGLTDSFKTGPDGDR